MSGPADGIKQDFVMPEPDGTWEPERLEPTFEINDAGWVVAKLREGLEISSGRVEALLLLAILRHLEDL